MFDCLYLSKRISELTGMANVADVHLFAYLSCLLFVYNGFPAGDWGYSFAGTSLGAPFGADLQDCLGAASMADLLRQDADRFLELTAAGTGELSFLQGLNSCEERIAYLEAAAATLLSMPTGLVKIAIGREPTLRPALALRVSRKLIESPAVELLYEQFRSLTAVIGSGRDLLIPATVWLTYLNQEAPTPNG